MLYVVNLLIFAKECMIKKMLFTFSLFLSGVSIFSMMPTLKNLQQATCLTQRFLSSGQDIQVGAMYKHYKGKFYRVMAIARHSEDPAAKFVVYKALYDSPGFGKNSFWVRPYDMFAEKVTIDGVQIDRFAKVIITKTE